MVAASSWLHKAIIAVEGVQAFVVLLVAGFGWYVAHEVQSAAGFVNQNDGPWQYEGNLSIIMDVRGDQLAGPPGPANQSNLVGKSVQPGGMVTHHDDDLGMARCQLHLNVNMRLNWGNIVDAKLKAKVDPGIKGNVKVGSLSIGDEKNACPSEKSYNGDCTYLRREVWQVVPRSASTRYLTTTMYAITRVLMIAWLALKLISLDGELLDAVAERVFCCCYKKGGLKGHTNAMNLKFGCLPDCLSKPLERSCLYLRFKIASNTIMWPLTTLAYNETCPNHIFTQLPGLVFWYVLAGIASMDLVYTMVLWVISLKWPFVKKSRHNSRWLRLPQALPALSALFGAMVVFMKSTWSLIFGFNFDLSMSFEISFKFGMFQVLFLLLTLLEMAGLVVKIVKDLSEKLDDDDDE